MPEVVKVLLEVLRYDTSETVRESVVRSLRQMGSGSPEVESVLLEVVQHDPSEEVRRSVTQSLIQLAPETFSTNEIVSVLLASLKSGSRDIRRDTAHLIGHLGKGSEQNLQALYQGLLDENNDVRTACVQGLVVLARRFPIVYQTVEEMFIQAVAQKKFDKQDNTWRSAHDYAYEGLWLLVVGGEIEGEEK